MRRSTNRRVHGNHALAYAAELANERGLPLLVYEGLRCTYAHANDRLMISTHDRYAFDGRDPNTYTNILWCFGRHDRPWVEGPIFGQIRWMSFESMKRKTNIDAYIREIEYLERTGKELGAI